MSVNEIVQFLVMAREHAKPRYLIADLEHLLAQYRVPFYGLFKQPKPGPELFGQILAGRWPDGWTERYIEKRYVLVDPMIRYLSGAEGGFTWETAIQYFDKSTKNGKMRRMLQDAKAHGLSHGYSFPVHSPRGLIGGLVLVGDELELSPLELSLFEQVAKVSLLELQKMEAVEGQAGQLDTGAVEATVRELEILNFLADGLTSQEIGELLKISPNTVDWHVNSLQEKHGARNRQHTVALAFRRGLIV
ncbi:LuxR family transcriptional regulator [Rhizobium sp. L1K21]|uniref:LuxR family transcriptional regulator n=1 Tax=Rhizobium sp. L1K21 TaxID=2954933 RepID=UPI00209218FC|nr:LuxR family transcriptional regulator [Rhizobium sp. L1K21]MCO6188119.1 LuxR family transcriptional regulator [Rhizobium sp. L1K21]